MTTEAPAKKTRRATLLKTKLVKQIIKDGGRRVSPAFIEALEEHVKYLILTAVGTHNGNKQTLDESVAAFIGLKRAQA